MPKPYYIVVFVFLLVACYEPPERKCEDFRTGTFTFTANIDGEEQTTTFIRTDKIEIEKFKGRQDTSSIRWLNDCEYVLKKLNAKSRAEERSIHIKILTTSDSSYTFEYNAIGDKRKLQGEALKIH